MERPRVSTVAYTSPFVPVEWIAAHGVRPLRVIPRQGDGAAAGLREGLCPFAQAFVAELAGGKDGPAAEAAIFTTTCDQMRRAPELLAARREMPVFLLNVPATWQGSSAGDLYVEELRRLGRFLVTLGGTAPTRSELADAMAAYAAAREELCRRRPMLTARRGAQMLCDLGSCLVNELPGWGERLKRESAGGEATRTGRIPVAVVGGPLGGEGLAVLDAIEAAGACIVLDGTETGERSLPGRWDPRSTKEDLLAELGVAYFDSIGDAFRRPSTRLDDWLRQSLQERRPRGVVLVRQVWCDLWHAQGARLREWVALPMLDLDVSCGAGAAAVGARIQSFMEILK